MHRGNNIATLLGFVAVLLWSTLALFTKLTKGIPPFQLLFLSFIIGASISFLWLSVSGRLTRRSFSVPHSAWLLSVGGLFFYHLFYFNALSHAPAVEAGLIAYLWPLLIVLFSSLLPDERLRINCIIGSVVAFIGAAALILLKSGGVVQFDASYTLGYLFAVACALTWSLYSVFNRHFSNVSSVSTVGFCFVVALLGLLCHLLSNEHWVMPNERQWLGVIGLGIGPVGLAFFVWDYGTKHGNIQLLGVLSYLAPLLSTLLLIVFTNERLTVGVIIGCACIVLGALIAVISPHHKTPNRRNM